MLLAGSLVREQKGDSMWAMLMVKVKNKQAK